VVHPLASARLGGPERRGHRRRYHAARRGGGGGLGKVLQRSADWPFNRFSTIAPVWRGRTVVLLGGGPSLGAAEFERVGRARRRDDCRVVAINNAYARCPDADVLYFADSRWWEWHRERAGFREFRGQRCSIEGTGSTVDSPDVHILRNAGTGDEAPGGLSTRPDALTTGANSGYQAIGFAIAAGASRIILLGYDMQYTGGRSHWHDGHPIKSNEGTYKSVFRSTFDKLKTDVPIINASASTALTCFPRATIESLLPDP
jgi:hypothetical protein